ncbi:MAG: N-acetylmuramoyl-L-alanine amidase, partial [Chloroflexia bacterium]
NGTNIATFVYGPGGERVKGTVDGVVTVYVGNHYEKQGSTIRKYYYAGAQRVAMRENGTLYWLLVDHLGSTAVVADASGAKVGEVRYKAWGEDRYTYGTTPTTYRYTGQRWEAGFGLYFYNARWYDPALGRFIQPDTVVPDPGDPQQLNRFGYVQNNPLRYVDLSGHYVEEGTGMKARDFYAVPPPSINTQTYTLPEGVEYGERGGAPVLGVVWHMTQGEDVEGALSAFQANGTSAHYLIDTDGTIYQVIPDEYAAWHAGGTSERPARWETSKYGETTVLEGIDVNRHTIGVEVVGYTPGSNVPKGHKAGYTEAQKVAATRLAKWLAYAYGLGPSEMVAHMDVCPRDKRDGQEYLFMLRMAVSPPLSTPARGYGGVFP